MVLRWPKDLKAIDRAGSSEIDPGYSARLGAQVPSEAGDKYVLHVKLVVFWGLSRYHASEIDRRRFV